MVFNTDDLLIFLASEHQNNINYENINITLNTLELNSNLFIIFIGAGIGWSFTSYKIINIIKKICCKKYINRNNSDINLIIAEPIV